MLLGVLFVFCALLTTDQKQSSGEERICFGLRLETTV